MHQLLSNPIHLRLLVCLFLRKLKLDENVYPATLLRFILKLNLISLKTLYVSAFNLIDIRQAKTSSVVFSLFSVWRMRYSDRCCSRTLRSSYSMKLFLSHCCTIYASMVLIWSIFGLFSPKIRLSILLNSVFSSKNSNTFSLKVSVNDCLFLSSRISGAKRKKKLASV